MEEVNFSVVQGDTFQIRVEYTDSNNLPIDLTDFSAKMDIRDRPGGKILCASLNSSDGIVIDGPEGSMDITIDSIQTRRFTTPSAAYHLKVINNGNQEESTILKGYFSVTPVIIR